MLRTVFTVTCLVLVACSLSASAAEAPESCDVTAERGSCIWEFDTREEPGRLAWTFDVPAFERNLAVITIVLNGVDGGWTYRILEDGPDGVRTVEFHVREQDATYRILEDGPDGVRTVEFHVREQDATPQSPVHREATNILFETVPEASYRLQFYPSTSGVQVGGRQISNVGMSGVSSGAFTVQYEATLLPGGEVPPRPAATRGDPHVIATANDARRGAYDITAGWMDDAETGDGLFEVHVALRDAVDWPWAEGNAYVRWEYGFDLLGDAFIVQWRLSAYEPAERVDDVEKACFLARAVDSGGRENVLSPLCRFDWDAGVLTAVVPERAVGSPGDAVPFTGMTIQAFSGEFAEGGLYSSYLDVLEDEAIGERYAFALGGPAVWDELNPRLAVAPPVELAWYQAPLAREHLPDTLQVLGALLAAGTFLAGAVILRRHRRFTKRLLTDVARVRADHREDAHAALLALGRLQDAIGDLYHEGSITEAQYQVVSQRIAFEATQFALRRELGLDDGSPGEDPSGSRALPRATDEGAPGEARPARP